MPANKPKEKEPPRGSNMSQSDKQNVSELLQTKDNEIFILQREIEMLKHDAQIVAKNTALQIELATARAESNMKTVALQAMERNFSARHATPLGSASSSNSSPFFSW